MRVFVDTNENTAWLMLMVEQIDKIEVVLDMLVKQKGNCHR